MLSKMLHIITCLFACCFCSKVPYARDATMDGGGSVWSTHASPIDSAADRILHFPSRLFRHVQDKTAKLDQQLTRQTEKYLQKMARQEDRLRMQLYRLDSTAAKRMFAGDQQQRYAALLQKMKTDTSSAGRPVSGNYIPYADSLQGALAFLNSNPQLLSSTGRGSGGKDLSPQLQAQLQSSLGQVRQLEGKMQDASEIRQFLQQRKEQIRACLSHYTHLPSGLTGIYSDYNKQVYYYGQQLEGYKAMLNDPDKMFRTALGLLNKLPAFTGFMRSNSWLSGLFGMPAGTAPAPGQVVQGMATRDQVLAAMQGQVGAGGPNAQSLIRGNISNAQGQLDQLRSKVGSGGGQGDLNVPDFKPNDQHTKSFFRRLEYGANLQSTHGNYYFPTTTDLGLSVGYKLDHKNVIGVGASYKIGWGNDLSHVNVSSQGVGLRSFLDVNLKGSFFASGGFEYNYQQPFTDLTHVRDIRNWQQSGLIGLSKIISMKTRVFKKTKIQLLWDFLSYEQAPKAQPLKFRVGYNF